MLKTFLLLIFLSPLLLPQNSISPKYYNSENIKKFGDYLFCSQDYLRAINEYNNYLKLSEDDTIKFKIGLSYSYMGGNLEAKRIFSQIQPNAPLFAIAELEYYKSSFKSDLINFKNNFNNEAVSDSNKNNLSKLYNYSYFYSDDELPLKEKFLSIYNRSEQKKINEFYHFKTSPTTKSPLFASILSALIPGLGKIYTDQIGDGITAFITTGVFAFLAYDNFHAHHNFRGWLFSGLGTFFYAGNIYGSAAAAQIYNAKLMFNFNAELNIYLESENYFIPKIDFCK